MTGDTHLNWGKLEHDGKVRTHGIHWTESEAKEVLIDKSASADEVRARYADGGGSASADDQTNAVEKTLIEQARKELDTMAVELGLDPNDYKNKPLLVAAIEAAKAEKEGGEDTKPEDTESDDDVVTDEEPKTE